MGMKTVDIANLSKNNNTTTCDNNSMELNDEFDCSNSELQSVVENRRTCKCHSARNISTSHGLNSLYVILFVLFVILYMSQQASALPSFLCHSRVKCLNGGTMHIPDGPFGFCQCICPRRFVGLRCEFNKLYNGRGRRVRRVNRLKRLVKIRNEVGYLLSDKRRHRHSQR
ncbi:hypothetical protein ACF0H5_006021 [Mactra antiquata]